MLRVNSRQIQGPFCWNQCCGSKSLIWIRIRIPFHLAAKDLSFRFDADLDTYLAPHQSDGKQRPHWSKDPPRLYFEPLQHYCERPRPSRVPFWASTAAEFWLWSGSGSGSRCWLWCGSMRIHAFRFLKAREKLFVAVADYFRQSVAISCDFNVTFFVNMALCREGFIFLPCNN